MKLKLQTRLAIRVLSVLAGALLISASSVFASAPACTEVFARPALTKSLRELPRLRIMTYNLENFFYDTESVAGKFKSPEEVKEIAEVILDQRPDVVVVQEVQNQRSLELFNAEYLKDRYQSFVLNGNDERGINVGFLLKKDLAVLAEIETHKDFKWVDPATKEKVDIFSRDLPALILRETDSSKPALIVFANHAKSKRDRPGDPESRLLRQAQIEAIAQITQTYATRFGRETPIIVAGDFNTDVRHSPEIRPLKKEFIDSFDVSPIQHTNLERATHTFHPRKGAREAHEMDAIFVNDILAHSVKSARVFRYRDEKTGIVMPLPRTFEERDRNPSDHFPVVVDFEIHPFLR